MKPQPQPGQVWRSGHEWRRVVSVNRFKQVLFETFDGIGGDRSDEWNRWSADAELVAGPGSESQTESEARK